MTLSPGDREIYDRRLKALASPERIEEHRCDPLGQHSADLTELLHFLRRSPDPELPSYTVLLLDDPPRWTVAVRPAERGTAMHRVDERTYESRAEAEHAVFLRRLEDYGLIAPSAAAAPSPVPPPGAPVGYADAISVGPGDRLNIHVRSATRWTAELVRLYSADLAPEGSALREEIVDTVKPLMGEAIEQSSPVGSHVRIHCPAEAPSIDDGFALSLFIMPTLPGDGRTQALISWRDAGAESGWTLMLDERGIPTFWLGDGGRTRTLSLDAPLVRGCWYRVVLSVDPAAMRASLACIPVGTRAANRVWSGRGCMQVQHFDLDMMPATTPGPILLAASRLVGDRLPQDCFDGRMESPVLMSGPCDLEDLVAGRMDECVILARWDFGAGIGQSGIATPAHVEDVSGNGWHGICRNHPTRGVTGCAWTGRVTDFRYAPDQYGAAHFHSDKMTDCDWTSQGAIDMPDDLASGVYAVRLTGGEGVDHIPFIVRPPSQSATAPLLLVLPTNSYLAYANDHVGVDSPRVQMLVRRALQFDAFDRLRHAQRDLGASLYEAHRDGSGICHSSWRRPILTMRPSVKTFNGRIWQFTSDLQIIDWLDRTGRAVDIVSDQDLHREGRAMLDRYQCVMTGSHPEYWTETMLDAVSDYVDDGGRLIYMGGNGFYWATAYDPQDDQVIEIRRWAGSQSWNARPGEYHLSFTGEPGGLWRNRGRAPQKLTGVGFMAAGLHDAGASYRVAIECDNAAAWVLDGVASGTFGECGTGGPAAGLEIDGIDPELGTPAETILIASSSGRHPDDMLEARENYGMTLAAPGGARNPRVRADMVLVPGENGGGVFSTGSIAWAGSLAHDAGVSRILANVLDRFCSGEPIVDPAC